MAELEMTSRTQVGGHRVLRATCRISFPGAGESPSRAIAVQDELLVLYPAGSADGQKWFENIMACKEPTASVHKWWTAQVEYLIKKAALIEEVPEVYHVTMDIPDVADGSVLRKEGDVLILCWLDLESGEKGNWLADITPGVFTHPLWNRSAVEQLAQNGYLLLSTD